MPYMSDRDQFLALQMLRKGQDYGRMRNEFERFGASMGSQANDELLRSALGGRYRYDPETANTMTYMPGGAAMGRAGEAFANRGMERTVKWDRPPTAAEKYMDPFFPQHWGREDPDINDWRRRRWGGG